MPGLALFGDNAYISNRYMVTPFKNVASGPKDAFNYFQSTSHITIECAFGMLVHRWGILRRPIPFIISLARSTSLVLCLCKLHNFCVDANDTHVPVPAAQDAVSVSVGGGFNVRNNSSNGDERPDELLDGGAHFDDYDRRQRRQEERSVRGMVGSIPRDQLLASVIEKELERKKPRGWNNKM